MFAGLAPAGNSNRRIQITGYTGKDCLLYFLPRSLQARLIARRILRRLGPVTDPSDAISITFQDGVVFEIIGPRGQIRPFRSVPE